MKLVRPDRKTDVFVETWHCNWQTFALEHETALKVGRSQNVKMRG